MDDQEFEKDLVCSVAEFIRSGGGASKANGLTPGVVDRDEERMTVVASGRMRMLEDEGLGGAAASESTVGPSRAARGEREIQSPSPSPTPTPAPATGVRKRVRFVLPASTPRPNAGVEEELRELTDAREAGMAFILGHCYVKAKTGSSFLRRLVINFGYDFLRRNSRGPNYAVTVPHASTLEVGMIYYV
ncbi:hypothetical protein CFC21_110363 [Triticum aestivum]|nr:hypothetical protein CFC21_110363 [Triticum aestivum]